MELSKYTIISIIILLFTTKAYGQQISTDMIQTPNASDIGKYGDLDVSCYTGQLDLTIPLFGFNILGCKLPINLKYDSSGVLVNKLPGWTGSNWTLQAGGAIIRTKYGTWDEVKPINQGSESTFHNYFSDPSRIVRDMNSDKTLKDNLYMNRCDYSADVFTFNFMGKTGKFFLGNDGQWKVNSNDNIDVVFDVKDESNYIYPFFDHYPSNMRKVPKGIKGFTLRDDNGFIYEFGGTTASIDYTIPFFRQMEQEKVECFFPTCWYLTSVKDKYGNEAYKFEYERGKFIAQFYIDEETIMVEEYDKMNGIHYGNSFMRNNDFFPYGGSLNSPVYLKRILTGRNEIATFQSVDSDIPTDKYYPNLNVKKYYHGASYDGLAFYFLQSNENEIKKYQFTQSGKSPIENPLYSTRLRTLTHINIDDIDIDLSYGKECSHFLKKITLQKGKEDEVNYDFKYYFPENIPNDRLAKLTDDWGYYNSGSFVKDEENPYGIDLYGSRFGALTEITYPTGGKTCLEYDIHDFSGCMADDRSVLESKTGKAGGLRIRKITEYDADGKKKLRQREFKYVHPETGSSSGELFASPRHSWENWYANTDSKSSYSKQSYYRNQSIIPLSNSFGPHIGYSCVKETEMDGNYKIYKYQNISSAHDERFIKDFSNGNTSPFDMYTERGYKRGKPLSIEQYSSDGGILSKHTFGYEQNELETDFVLTSNLRRGNYGNSAVFGFYTGGIYKLLFPKYDIVTDTLYTYNGNHVIKDISIYSKRNNNINVSYKYSHKAIVRTTTNEIHKRGNFQEERQYEYPFSSNDETTKKMSLIFFDVNPYRKMVYRNGHLLGGTEYSFTESNIGPVKNAIYRINTDGTKNVIERYSEFSNYGLPNTINRNGMDKISIGWNMIIMTPATQTIGGSKISDGKAFTTEVDYDTWGNPTDITYPNGYIKSFERDALGKIKNIVENYQYPIRINEYNYKNNAK